VRVHEELLSGVFAGSVGGIEQRFDSGKRGWHWRKSDADTAEAVGGSWYRWKSDADAPKVGCFRQAE
jgi:hypothetical protein